MDVTTVTATPVVSDITATVTESHSEQPNLVKHN